MIYHKKNKHNTNIFNSCLRALTKHLHIVYEISNLTNKLSKELFQCMSESANLHWQKINIKPFQKCLVFVDIHTKKDTIDILLARECIYMCMYISIFKLFSWTKTKQGYTMYIRPHHVNFQQVIFCSWTGLVFVNISWMNNTFYFNNVAGV